MDPITLTEALAITARIGTDDPPSSDELTAARKAYSTALRSAKEDFASFAAALRSDTKDEEQVNPLQSVKDFRQAFDLCGEALKSVTEEEERLAAAVAESVGELDDDEGDGGDGEELEVEPDPDAEPEVPAPTADLVSLEKAAARLVSNSAPKPEAPVTAATQFEILAGERLKPVDTYTMADLARDAAQSGEALRAGKHVLAKVRATRPEQWRLSTSAEANTGILDAIMSPESIMAHATSNGAIAAAGGCCFLPETLDQPQLAGSTARPIRDSLPTFNSATGAVQYYAPICLPTDGVALWSCDQDAAVDPDDPDTWKVCHHIECPDVIETNVEGIYLCIEIGNFQQRFGANLWQNYLAQARSEQARLAENRLFALMIAATNTTHPGPETGSAWVNLVQAIAVARADIVQQQRYLGVAFRLWGPAWYYSAIKADLVARRVIEDPSVVSDATIDGWLASLGVTFIASPDNGDDFAFPQSDAIEIPYPAEANFILAPEGHYGFLDGGTLDLGTDIRDRDGNRQNIVAAFAESFEGLVVRGCNAKHLVIDPEVCEQTVCGPTVIAS